MPVLRRSGVVSARSYAKRPLSTRLFHSLPLFFVLVIFYHVEARYGLLTGLVAPRGWRTRLTLAEEHLDLLQKTLPGQEDEALLQQLHRKDILRGVAQELARELSERSGEGREGGAGAAISGLDAQSQVLVRGLADELAKELPEGGLTAGNGGAAARGGAEARGHAHSTLDVVSDSIAAVAAAHAKAQQAAAAALSADAAGGGGGGGTEAGAAGAQGTKAAGAEGTKAAGEGGTTSASENGAAAGGGDAGGSQTAGTGRGDAAADGGGAGEGSQASSAEGSQAASAEGSQAASAEGSQAASAEGSQAASAEGSKAATGAGDTAVAEGGAGSLTPGVCTDTCGSAKNGVCDEGRPQQPKVPAGQRDPDVYSTLCDLGTDCSDCGAWDGPAPINVAAQGWQPVQQIRAKGFPVNVRQTETAPHFWQAYTDPALDQGVSLQLDELARVDPPLTALWQRILKRGCLGTKGERRLVLDVGANFGYFTLLAASMGCRVIAWEPVPYFAAFLQYGLLRNGVTDLVEVRSTAVGDDPGAQRAITVPQRGLWNTAGVNGINIDKSVDNQGDYDSVVTTVERLDQVVKEDVLLMKVSAGGFEPWVIKGMESFFIKRKLDNIMLDYNPVAWERENNVQMLVHHPATLVRLVSEDFLLLHLAELKVEWEGREPQELHVVTKAVLKHDIEDMYRLQAGVLGCPVPGALANMPGMWACNQMPAGFHPYSFRSSFDGSTQLWGVQVNSPSRALARPGPTASLFPHDYALEKFFTMRQWGMGRQPCQGLPPEQRVAARCRCRDDPACGDLEGLVQVLASRGKMPPTDPPRTADMESFTMKDFS